jgi:hypothetical protein
LKSLTGKEDKDGSIWAFEGKETGFGSGNVVTLAISLSMGIMAESSPSIGLLPVVDEVDRPA